MVCRIGITSKLALLKCTAICNYYICIFFKNILFPVILLEKLFLIILLINTINSEETIISRISMFYEESDTYIFCF